MPAKSMKGFSSQASTAWAGIATVIIYSVVISLGQVLSQEQEATKDPR
jgi:hypothetical protein